MKRTLLIAIALMTLTALSLARPMQEETPRPALKTVASAIQTELESHGERVLGKELYHWSTRLEKLEDCRAEFSVRLTSNLADSTVRVETVDFSLGALDPAGIEIQKHWLQLPCATLANCVFSTSTCSRKYQDGIVIDCATASQKRVSSFALQLDDDNDSAQRLQQSFRQAVEACREPSRVTF
jgi:hypothetical protein